MTRSSGPQRLALRGMVGFQCTGDACEDTCCHGWTVVVDEGHHQKLKRAFERAGDRAAFDAAFTRNHAPTRDSRSFALLVHRDNGDCRFLDERRMCGLQQRFGEPLLPDVCSVYPRRIAQVGARLELLGALSCPEVARRVLLPDDGMDLVPAGPAPFGRGVLSYRLTEQAAEVTQLDLVRVTMVRAASAVEWPLATRLAAMAWFAWQVGDVLRPHGVPDDGRVERAAATLDSPSLWEELDRARRAGPGPDLAPLPTAIAAGAFAVRFAGGGYQGMRRLAAEALASFALEPDGGVTALPEAAFRVAPPSLHAAWLRRRAVIAPLGERLDRWLTNYLRHAWIDDWYIFSLGLLPHLRRLFARLAALRFLLVAHPRLAHAATRPDAEEGARLADAFAVEACMVFCRAMEHSERFADDLQEAADAALPTFAHALAVACSA